MRNKKYIIVTGGEGFIGSHLIERLINVSNFHIVSLDNNYSKANYKLKNNKRIKYFRISSDQISHKLNDIKNKIHAVFHFGEFSRIVPSFKYLDDCFKFNLTCTLEVVKFCQKNDIRLIYSASSSIFGNYGLDQNLSPYSWSKAKNIELIKNFSKWFGLRYEIAYFYNVYGVRQICSGKMASVIGIFMDQYSKNLPLTIVKPGNQKRDFTHVDDIISGVLKILSNGKNSEYLLKFNKSYSIIQIAKMFNHPLTYLEERPGERFKSSTYKNSNAEKILNFKAKIDIKDYIYNFINQKI